MRLFLTGFMGAGKTTVGRGSASGLGVPFVDLDDEIERAPANGARDSSREHGEARLPRARARGAAARARSFPRRWSRPAAARSTLEANRAADRAPSGLAVS